jgi:pre-mRNA-splicing factor ATP-dependent RNA helicase DHX16
METEDRKKIIPQIRKESRREYMKKRREAKLEDLEMTVQDEEYLFSETRLV